VNFVQNKMWIMNFQNEKIGQIVKTPNGFEQELDGEVQ